MNFDLSISFEVVLTYQQARVRKQEKAYICISKHNNFKETTKTRRWKKVYRINNV